jgi:hypothetical protein
MNWAEMIEEEIFLEAADLARLEGSTIRSVINPLFREAREELAARLMEEWDTLSYTSKERMRGFIYGFTEMLDQTALLPIEPAVAPVFNSLMVGTVAQAAGEINSILKIPLISTTAPPSFYAKVADKALIEGQPLFDYERRDGSPSWWLSLRQATRDKFARSIRQSLVIGESTKQATKRLLGHSRNGLPFGGDLGTARRHAETLARTGIHAVTNATRSTLYEENQDVIEGVQSLATLDSRTTILCRSYEGLKWRLPDYTPMGNHGKAYRPCPRHMRCRSVHMPVLLGLKEIDRKAREMGLEITEPVRASADGPRVRKDATMNGWLRSKSEDDQNQMLGKRRAELWRAGKVSLRDLVDSQGEVIPVGKLEERARLRSLPN